MNNITNHDMLKEAKRRLQCHLALNVVDQDVYAKAEKELRDRVAFYEERAKNEPVLPKPKKTKITPANETVIDPNDSVSWSIKLEDLWVSDRGHFPIGTILKNIELVEEMHMEGVGGISFDSVGHIDVKVIGYGPINTANLNGNMYPILVRAVGKATRCDDAGSKAAWERYDKRHAK